MPDEIEATRSRRPSGQEACNSNIRWERRLITHTLGRNSATTAAGNATTNNPDSIHMNKKDASPTIPTANQNGTRPTEIPACTNHSPRCKRTGRSLRGPGQAPANHPTNKLAVMAAKPDAISLIGR